MTSLLQEMDHPVYVLTTQHQGKVYGCVITWVMRASLNQKETKIAFVMSKFNHTLTALTHQQSFILNRLSTGQMEEFFQLGTSHSLDTDKFQPFLTESRLEGLILKNCSGYAVGRIESSLETPDRIIFYASLGQSVELKPETLKLGSALNRLSPEQKEILTRKMQHDGERDEKQFTPS